MPRWTEHTCKDVPLRRKAEGDPLMLNVDYRFSPGLAATRTSPEESAEFIILRVVEADTGVELGMDDLTDDELLRIETYLEHMHYSVKE